MKVWTIAGRTESGDDFVFVVKNKMNYDEALEFVAKQMPWEFEDWDNGGQPFANLHNGYATNFIITETTVHEND